MRKLLIKQIVRNFLFAILAGVIYALLSLIDKGHLEINGVISTTVGYFLISCLMSVMAPKLRKLTGHEEGGK